MPVAAICGATYALAAAGLLDRRPHTGPARAFLASTGYAGTEHFVDELVVTDGDLITASPVAPVEFARAIFARLGMYEPGDAGVLVQAVRRPGCRRASTS